jgi:hypothetical protein
MLFSIETLSITTVSIVIFSITAFSIAKNDTGNSELKMGHVFAFFD